MAPTDIARTRLPDRVLPLGQARVSILSSRAASNDGVSLRCARSGRLPRDYPSAPDLARRDASANAAKPITRMATVTTSNLL